MARSKNRLVADWFAKIRANATTGEVEHADVVTVELTPGPTGATGPQGAAFTYADFTAAQLSALTGPQGATGATGPQGPAGPVGATFTLVGDVLEITTP